MKFFRIAKGLIRAKLFKNPFYTLVYVTRRCNYRCRACNVWHYAKREEEMSLASFEKVADNLAKLGVTNIVLTGGEPFLREDFPEIIKIFSAHGKFSIRVQTNGGPHLTEALLDRAIEAGLDDISVSLDSLDPAKQDYLCNSSGAWENAVKTLKLIIKIIPHNLTVVNTIVNGINLDEIPEIIKFVSDLGAYSAITPVTLAVSPEKKSLHRGYSKDLLLSNIDKKRVDQIYSQILKMKKEGYSILSSTKFLENSREVIKDGNMRWTCDAGELYFVVFPDGSISPCGESCSTLNILASDFLVKYYSDNYRQEFKDFRNKCIGCTHGCWKETSYLIHDISVQWERLRTFVQLNRRFVGQPSRAPNSTNQ